MINSMRKQRQMQLPSHTHTHTQTHTAERHALAEEEHSGREIVVRNTRHPVMAASVSLCPYYLTQVLERNRSRAQIKITLN